MSNEKFLFDFGGMTPEDMARIKEEMKQRGINKLEMDETQAAAGRDVGGQFLGFLIEVLRALGLLDSLYRPRYRFGISVEAPENAPLPHVLQAGWNERAEDWAVVETPANYAITMQTLIEFLRVNPQKRKETFLSLGSGPGLYETFLGSCLQAVPESSHVKILCVDYAERMTQLHKKVLRNVRTAEGEKLTNVVPITDNMMHLSSIDAGVIDQIICNNALQWAVDWRAAIAEMQRVISSKGSGWLYLFIHRHPMVVCEMGQVEPVIRLPEVPFEELLDVLEAHRFLVRHARQLVGARGLGQACQGINRVFILARYQPEGEIQSWRTKGVSAVLRTIGGKEV